jgi:hypothetical protein
MCPDVCLTSPLWRNYAQEAAELFPSGPGRPSVPPEVVASVLDTVTQLIAAVRLVGAPVSVALSVGHLCTGCTRLRTRVPRRRTAR